jgi:anti-anti-sigma factor
MFPDSDGFAVTVLTAADVPAAVVRLAGDIDIAATVALSEAIDRLSTLAPATVMIDLADVTFACSTLPNFLARVHQVLPIGSTLTVCRPPTGTLRILQMTGMDQIATLRADLPASGSRSALDGMTSSSELAS